MTLYGSLFYGPFWTFSITKSCQEISFLIFCPREKLKCSKLLRLRMKSTPTVWKGKCWTRKTLLGLCYKFYYRSKSVGKIYNIFKSRRRRKACYIWCSLTLQPGLWALHELITPGFAVYCTCLFRINFLHMSTMKRRIALVLINIQFWKILS